MFWCKMEGPEKPDLLHNATTTPHNTIAKPSTEETTARQCSTSAEDTRIQTAAQQVFTTYELLEQILSHLVDFNFEARAATAPGSAKLKTLLLSRRVNKTFHHVIQRSVELQKALFFKRYAPETTFDEMDEDDLARWNPFFVWQKEREGEDDSMAVHLTCEIGFTFEDTKLDLNTYTLPSSFSLDDQHRKTGMPPVVESWRRMQVFQPLQDMSRFYCVYSNCSLNIEEGTTMEELWERLQDGTEA